MYTLYHNNETREIKLTPARKSLQNLNYRDDVAYYNGYYFICTKRKPLKEKAVEIKQQWIEGLEEELSKVRSIKI